MGFPCILLFDPGSTITGYVWNIKCVLCSDMNPAPDPDSFGSGSRGIQWRAFHHWNCWKATWGINWRGTSSPTFSCFSLLKIKSFFFTYKDFIDLDPDTSIRIHITVTMDWTTFDGQTKLFLPPANTLLGLFVYQVQTDGCTLVYIMVPLLILSVPKYTANLYCIYLSEHETCA